MASAARWNAIETRASGHKSTNIIDLRVSNYTISSCKNRCHIKACRDGFTAYFTTTAQLFRDLEMARADGSYRKTLRSLSQVDALLVDDWAMTAMTEPERRAFLAICDARYQTRATLLTSQYPVAKWHGQIGDPTIADSILDRLVHTAHRIAPHLAQDPSRHRALILNDRRL